MPRERGQGTVEYLAVVLLVTVVLGAGAATAAGAGTDIATAVPHQVLRALCIVTRGDCDRDRAPCDIGAKTASSTWSATIAVVRLGHGRVLVVERRSDHKVLVTLTTTPSAGLQSIEGAGARIERGRRRLSLGGAVTASAVAGLGHGRTWILPNDAAARAFVAALERGDDVRTPDQDVRQGDLDLGVSASRGVGDAIAGNAALTATLRGSAGVRTDHVTGEKTYFLEGGADAVLDLTAGLRSLRATASGQAAGAARLALTVDGTGRWVDLALLASGELSASGRLPRSAGPLADALDVPTAGGRRWAAEAHLDLSEAGNLAAAKALVAAVDSIPPAPIRVRDAAAAIGRRIEERAVLDVRAYALDRTANGFDVHAGVGVGIGAGHETSTENTRLIAASTRGLDGRWRRRDDCLKEARA
jgi:hypothetical protein